MQTLKDLHMHQLQQRHMHDIHGPFFTSSELAEKMDVTRATIDTWCRRGYFPNAAKPGKTWLIPAADLDGFKRPKRGRPKKKKKSK